jgi:hypothetical protein
MQRVERREPEAIGSFEQTSLFPKMRPRRIPGVNWLRRLTPPVRLGLVAVSLVALLLLARFLAAPDENRLLEDVTGFAGSSEIARPEAVPPQTVATSMGLDALGAPDDLLPQPISDPIQGDEAADTLARQVLAGTPESLPALVGALRTSGIGILGPANSSDIKPAEPWQGMVMRRWEVRAAAAMVLPERTVVVTLPDLAAVLVEAIPQLKGAPLEQLIVKDLRALAGSQVPTKRFFGRFIAALGRNAVNHEPYDLLRDVDASAIQFDGMQASLIFRRLATDFLMLAGDARDGKKAATLFDRLPGWFAPTVHAQSPPCTLSERERTIVDLVGLGTQLGFGGVQVGDLGFEGLTERIDRSGNLGTLSTIANTVLAYAQFIAVYAALAADVELDAPPLVRTKKMTPQTGERKQLTAVVKLNIGNGQIVNCFRIMLDFSLPNDGPVKGAVVTWYGVEGFDQGARYRGGSEAIVQFVSSGSQRVTNAVTGDDGKVQIGVEGRGQLQTISNDATEVSKSAKVRLHVALRGADFLGDLQEAAGTAAGGLGGLPSAPLGILSRMQWASVGHYTFPVTDWRDGPARWTGTITYTKVTAWKDSTAGKAIHQAQDHREALTLNITITETLEGSSVFGGGAAMLRGTAQANYTARTTRSGGRLTQCERRVFDLTFSQVNSGEGTGAGTARATVGISADGQYSVSFNPDVMMTTTAESTSQQLVLRGRCQVETQSSASPSARGSMPVSDSMQGDGKIDPKMPNRLSGRTEEKEAQTTRTLTWDLQRQ